MAHYTVTRLIPTIIIQDAHLVLLSFVNKMEMYD